MNGTNSEENLESVSMIENVHMDNFSYQRDPEKATELELVRGEKNGAVNQASTSCDPDACREARERPPPQPQLHESPWHMRKTLFLLGIIVILIIWTIVYTTLSQLKML